MTPSLLHDPHNLDIKNVILQHEGTASDSTVPLVKNVLRLCDDA